MTNFVYQFLHKSARCLSSSSGLIKSLARPRPAWQREIRPPLFHLLFQPTGKMHPRATPPIPMTAPSCHHALKITAWQWLLLWPCCSHKSGSSAILHTRRLLRLSVQLLLLGVPGILVLISLPQAVPGKLAALKAGAYKGSLLPTMPHH